jgi:hypothetical protein
MDYVLLISLYILCTPHVFTIRQLKVLYLSKIYGRVSYIAR